MIKLRDLLQVLDPKLNISVVLEGLEIYSGPAGDGRYSTSRLWDNRNDWVTAIKPYAMSIQIGIE